MLPVTWHQPVRVRLEHRPALWPLLGAVWGL